MTQYKYYYFNVRARGEPIRLIFAAAGQKYEDFRIEQNEWPQYKQKSPNLKCPYLEIHEGGKVHLLGESLTLRNILLLPFKVVIFWGGK
jgi:hypothetical protein